MEMDEEFPKKLYKCRDFSVNSLDILGNSHLYFSKLDQLNDPFENRKNVDFNPFRDGVFDAMAENLGLPAAIVSVAKSGYQNNPIVKDAVKYLANKYSHRLTNSLKTKVLNNTCLYCFSANKKSELLWYHYANGLRGFALEFDTGMLTFDGSKATRFLKKVHYPDIGDAKVPVIEISDTDLSNGNREKNTAILERKIFLTKAPDWKYEAEWRATKSIDHSLETHSQFVRFNKEALTGIIFGELMPLNHINIVKELARSYPNVQFMRAVMSQEYFQLNIVPFNE